MSTPQRIERKMIKKRKSFQLDQAITKKNIYFDELKLYQGVTCRCRVYKVEKVWKKYNYILEQRHVFE